MNSMNSVTILGNVVRDPVVRTTKSGTLYAYFTVATSKTLVNPRTGEAKEAARYVPVTAWRKQAEIVQTFLRKGTKVFVHAEVASRSYDQGQERKYVTEVTADFIVPAPQRNEPPSGGASYGGGGNPSGGAPQPGSQQHGNWDQFADRPHATQQPMQQDTLPMGQQPGAAPFPEGGQGQDEDIPF